MNNLMHVLFICGSLLSVQIPNLKLLDQKLICLVFPNPLFIEVVPFYTPTGIASDCLFLHRVPNKVFPNILYHRVILLCIFLYKRISIFSCVLRAILFCCCCELFMTLIHFFLLGFPHSLVIRSSTHVSFQYLNAFIFYIQMWSILKWQIPAWEKCQISLRNLVVPESKEGTNDGDMSKGQRNRIEVPTGQIWDNLSNKINDRS